MNNLLHASFSCLLRDKVFYLCAAIVLILEICIVLNDAPILAEWAKAGEDAALENCCYNLAPMLGFAFAAFVCLFVGVEYSDGTLRNKLIAGHSKRCVFLSFFLISAFACVCITAVSLIGGLSGLFYFDGFGFGWDTYFVYAFVLCCSAILFAAIFTTISMLIPNRAISVVVSLAIWFALLFIGSGMINVLGAPEMTCDYAWIAGEAVPGEPYPNPDHVGGTMRSVLLVFSHALPICPAINMSNGSLDQPILDIVYSVGTTVIVLFIGCAAFRRKDLR